ncbi:MAG: hypothetical protein ACP5T3_02355 [Candidatus Micrarchaeia archaeon]
MPATLKAYVSTDMRIRTEQYETGGKRRFSIAEPTAIGTLLTEFSQNGEVLRQEYRKGRNALVELASFTGAQIRAEETGKQYEGVKVMAKCTKCGGEIARELDLVEPGKIGNAPVVPTYVCKACKTRYYSMNDEFLRWLMEGAKSLFEPDELEEKNADERAFEERMQATILRIFATKKIFKLSFEK